MSSVRKRTWTSPNGEEKTRWVVDYKDSAGKRRAKQFVRKKEADAWLIKTAWHVTQGPHTPDSQSITVISAGELWLARARRDQLEHTTIAAYEQHLRLHIVPLLGHRKLSQLTKPAIEAFRDILIETRSRPMAARVMRSLRSLIGEAERRGYIAQNVAHGVAVRRANRDQRRIEIPSKVEMRAMVDAAKASDNPMDAPLVLTCVFQGLRASELRGLPWRSVDLRAGTLHIEQRADSRLLIGPPKSSAGRRIVPLADCVVSSLRKWRLRCPATDLDLVFPSPRGKPLSHASLHKMHLWPVQVTAGICDPKLDSAGDPVIDNKGAIKKAARYSTHALRHCAASLWIEQRVNPKRIQKWIGHSSIQMTFDVYGHLFDQADADAAVMAAVEREVFGAVDATQLQQEA
ncbi:MAG: site-specific integrase [Sphingosinicella sp.]|nr:site-specific integrase [Sphingosinicella sp.]